jgi:hypothetical protein
MKKGFVKFKGKTKKAQWVTGCGAAAKGLQQKQARAACAGFLHFSGCTCGNGIESFAAYNKRF